MATLQKDPQAKKVQDDDQIPAGVGGGGAGKESEPAISFEDEAKIVAEIGDRSSAIDREALDRVREQIPEAKQAMPEPELSPDVEDARVSNPQTDADNVVIKGATLNLPFSEGEYNKGLHIRIAGKIMDKTVVGVSSLVALSMWIGRLIKMAHKHAMKVVFRKDKNAD